MHIELIPLLDKKGNPLMMGQRRFANYGNKHKITIASMPDYYELGKNGSQRNIKDVQKDFKESIIISATRLIHSKDGLEGRIMHGYGSKILTFVQKRLIIPYFNYANLDEILDTEEGVLYAQALFSTNDVPKQIKKNIERLGNRDSKHIKFYTLSQEERAINPNRVAYFGCLGDELHVRGNYGFDGYGRSREVKFVHDSAKKTTNFFVKELGGLTELSYIVASLAGGKAFEHKGILYVPTRANNVELKK